jgi:hypothetical protein
MKSPDSVDDWYEWLVKTPSRWFVNGIEAHLVQPRGRIDEWYEKWLTWLRSSTGEEVVRKNLTALADLMQIPKKNYDYFCRSTLSIFLTFAQSCLIYRRGPSKDAALLDAEQKIRAAHKAVCKLCETKGKYDPVGAIRGRTGNGSNR